MNNDRLVKETYEMVSQLMIMVTDLLQTVEQIEETLIQILDRPLPSVLPLP